MFLFYGILKGIFMKNRLITTLRSKDTTTEQFRQAADQLAIVLAIEAETLFPTTIKPLETPLAKTQGVFLKQEIILVPILRSGLILLPPFMHFYPGSKIGFIGTRRDEVTAIPKLYYHNLPPFSPDSSILLLDPMIATGGSATLAVKILKEAGIAERQIALIAFIASPQGVNHFHNACPDVKLIVAQIDEGLDSQKRIIPGLGDFGDRYFGTI